MVETSLKRSEDKEKKTGEHTTRITSGELFLIFLKAGLAFGGGLGILAVLEEELVDQRRAVTKEEFLTIYGIGRIVPSGTMTAVLRQNFICGRFIDFTHSEPPDASVRRKGY
jgi:hypothetical protein